MARWAVLKTILIASLFAGLAAVLIPWLLVAVSPAWLRFDASAWRWLGLALLGPGALLSGWCAVSFATVGLGTPAPFDPPRVLVVRGPYGVVRNPMVAGLLLALGGETLLFQSYALALYTLLIFAAMHLFVVYYEEPTLKAKFGEDYERYLAEVPRWLPRMRGL